MEGTYSGTGYIMFQPENLEYKIPDFCTWSGKFEAFVVATDAPPEPGSVAHIIADGQVQTLLNVDAFTDNLNVIEAQVIENILSAPTRADARHAAQDGIDQINDLKKATLDELQAIFANARDAAKQVDPRFRQNEKELWDCYLRNTADSKSIVRNLTTTANALVRDYLKNGGPANLPRNLNRLNNRTNATASNGLAVIAGTKKSKIDDTVPSMIFLVETNTNCTANDIDFVQFISYEWSFVKIDPVTHRVTITTADNVDETELNNANTFLQDKLLSTRTQGEGAGGPGRLVPDDFAIGKPFPDVPLSSRQSGNPSYPIIGTETYAGTEYKGMEDPPHVNLAAIKELYRELISGGYNTLFPLVGKYNGISVIQKLETSIRCKGDVIGRWTWQVYNVYDLNKPPSGDLSNQFAIAINFHDKQPDDPNYAPNDDDLKWDGFGNRSPIYDSWIDANGDIKQDLRNP
ncbi:MAG: hypothetical protein NUW37_11385 [Planctomycetes bacterium]|nr:hypothetical protein [Planctomycetota bacterium]